MAVQISALNLGTPLVAAGTWRSRTFTIIYSHGGDCRSLLGGFPLSGPAEAVLRRDPGQSCWSAHLWHCVSRRPLDAVSQAGLADEHQLARCQPRRHDVLIPVRPGRAGVSRYAEASADEIPLFEYPDRDCGGVPLGVCSNCVAPIARGLYASGMGTESVLAAMFASPALNLVVLAMTFALFPLPIALLKLATVLFLILVFVPFVSARQGESEPPFNFAVEIPSSETWGQAPANAGGPM